jgi:hypothetical protein
MIMTGAYGIGKFAISKEKAQKALAQDGMELDDYSSTIFGLIWDGFKWEVLEDSLSEEEALAWASKAAGYGEVVGLFKWEEKS